MADSTNNRILRYDSPFTSFTDEADLVLGQDDFVTETRDRTGDGNEAANSLDSPQHLSFDPDGNLWVADRINNRVLKYAAPFTNDENAVSVLGQALFTTKLSGAAINRLNAPIGVASDASGNIWVADTSAHRVLRFDAPFTDGEDAAVVLGQANFISAGINRGAGAGNAAINSLYNPTAVAVDADGNLWVADQANHRVVRYDAPLTIGEDAAIVLGQADFTSESANRGTGIAINTLQNPGGVNVDSSGNLWIADASNNRLVQYSPLFTDGEDAALVLGQADFETASNAVTIVTLAGVRASDTDSTGNLFAGGGQSRVLGFLIPAIISSGCDDCTAPSMRGTGFLQIPDGFSINGATNQISSFSQTIPTNLVQTGMSTEIKLRVYEKQGQSNISFVGLFFNESNQNLKKHDSMMKILFYKNKPVQIIDNSGLIQSADVRIESSPLNPDNANSAKVVDIIFDITFANPTNTLDIAIDVWDISRNSESVYLNEAIQVITPIIPTIPNVDTIESEDDVQQLVDSRFLIKRWAGFSADTATDEEILEYLGIDSDQKIPLYLKELASWVVKNKITLEEFEVAAKFVLNQSIIKKN